MPHARSLKPRTHARATRLHTRAPARCGCCFAPLLTQLPLTHCQVFKNAIQSLSEADQQLPLLQRMLPTLKRGIAVHHSGLLPTIKELVGHKEGVWVLLGAVTVCCPPSSSLLVWRSCSQSS